MRRKIEILNRRRQKWYEHQVVCVSRVQRQETQLIVKILEMSICRISVKRLRRMLLLRIKKKDQNRLEQPKGKIILLVKSKFTISSQQLTTSSQTHLFVVFYAKSSSNMVTFESHVKRSKHCENHLKCTPSTFSKTLTRSLATGSK